MLRARILCLWIISALLLVNGRPVSADETTEALENELQSAGLGIDRDSLVGFLNGRSQLHVDSARLDALIKQLGSTDAPERRSAYRDLVALGSLSIPALRETANDPDDGIRSTEALRCLKLLTTPRDTELTLATSQLLAERHPAEAIDVLLTFLPNVESEEAHESISETILNLAARQEEVPASLVKALRDELHLRRAIALDALRARDVREHVELLTQALKDPSPTVQLKAAQGLARAHDERAVKAMIQLLTELPLSDARKAEDSLLSIAGETAPQSALGDTDDSRKQAQATWNQWWNGQSADKLLAEISRRTLTDAKRTKAEALIKMLADNSFDERQKASKELIEMGPSVAPILRKLVDDKDPEVRQRVKECLALVDKSSGGPLSPIVPQLLAFRRPEGAVEAMLNYLPFVEEQSGHESILSALKSLAYQDGVPSKALLAALESKNADVRAAAASSLCQPGKEKMIAKAMELLKDGSWSVRMRAALALVNVRERSAVPVLIGSIAQLSDDETLVAQDYLLGLAGEQQPDGVGAGTPQQRSAAWLRWWNAQGDKVKLVSTGTIHRRRPFLGNSLAVHTYNSMITEYDRSGKKRWSITGLSSPRDAVVVGRNRVVVLETGLRQLTERDLRGKILKRVQLNGNVYPIDLQILPNGNRLVVAYNQILEINRAGKTVSTYNRPQNDLRGARRLKNGETILISSNNRAYRISRNGKELKSWQLVNTSNVLGYDILPNGNVLIPNKYGNSVIEYDINGKQIWTASVNRPESVRRLPNGQTVVGNGRSPYQLTFIDRNGKTVKTVTTNMRTMNLAHR